MVQEFLPIIDGEGEVLAVVALWRDATDLDGAARRSTPRHHAPDARRGLLLAGLLFLVFRAAQARLSRQHGQLSRRPGATR